ncbi:MAG: nucleobase:cation symporter, family [Thermoanaerobacterium sp.]|nr:nucleobase:cation symporter, family [Thermoanaerobacterium sp.]
MKEQLFELTKDLSNSRLYNEDLAPTTIKQRTWDTYHFLSLWVGMSFSIPTFMLASGLISLGMNWKQAIFTIFVGNLIVLIPMILNGHSGTKYGIPFPVLCRSAFGTFGANIAALLRAGVACGWFGIQTYIGGSAINTFLGAVFPGWLKLGGDFNIFGLTLPQAITFMIFWLITMYIIFRGMNAVKKLEAFAAPLLVLYIIALFIWAVVAAKGLGPIVSQPGKLTNFGEFFKVFIPSLTGMIGFWATLSLNIPDFTRFAKGQKSQILGQALGLPTSMGLFSLLGVLIASATIVIYGEPIWDFSQLMTKFSNPIVSIISLLCVIFATLTTNIAANVVSPANDFSNLLPKYISFKSGGLITGIIGILIMPWRLLADPSGYIYNWLGTYSGVLGPIAGIMICDYWIYRRTKLNLMDLYTEEGEYFYSKGFNIKAIIALIVGVFFALIGKIVPMLSVLSDYAWFVGFFVSGILYFLLMYNTSVQFYNTEISKHLNE